jgi:hypothetical protein
MGAFYVTYTLRGTNQTSVLRFLAGRRTFVSPEQNGLIVVFDEDHNSHQEEHISILATRLSAGLLIPVLAVKNHDSDVLWYQLYNEFGKLADAYNSTPHYWFPTAPPSPPEGGDAKLLCAAFGAGDIAEIQNILQASGKRYPDATVRHADLARALKFPSFFVASAFGNISDGYLPRGLSVEDLRNSSAASYRLSI